MSKEIARGAAWMVLFRFVDRAIGVVSTAVLARLLIPADFGLVAMAMSIIAVVELATSFSFEIALIQKPDPTREHFDTAWTLNVLVGLAGALVIAGLAAPTASFYGDERLAPVMWAIGAAWLLYGLENTGTANFRRDMDFGTEFRFMASKRLAGFVVTMIAAFVLRSYWALVIGTIAGRVAGVAMSYVMHPFRPRPCLSKTRELFGFSGWVLLNNFVGVLLSKVPHLYIGRVFGAQAVGTYTVGAEIAQLAHTELIAPINRAMFPGYARLVTDPDAFRRTCLQATAVIMLLVFPMCVGIAVLAGPFVRLLLGAQWGAAVPVIQVLALAGAIAALTSNNVSVYLALGRPYLVTSILLTRLVVLAVAMVVLSPKWQVMGVALAEVAASVASMLVSQPTLFSAMKIRVSEYLATMWRPLAGSALMGGVIHYLIAPGFAHEHATGAMRELLVGTALGAVVYLLAVGAMWWLAGRPDTVEVTLAQKLLGAIRRGRPVVRPQER